MYIFIYNLYLITTAGTNTTDQEDTGRQGAWVPMAFPYLSPCYTQVVDLTAWPWLALCVRVRQGGVTYKLKSLTRKRARPRGKVDGSFQGESASVVLASPKTR